MEQEEQEKPTVEWMPGVLVGVLTFVITRLFWVLGTAIAVVGLIGLVVLLVQHRKTPARWVCLGAVLGYGVFWALFGGGLG